LVRVLELAVFAGAAVRFAAGRFAAAAGFFLAVAAPGPAVLVFFGAVRVARRSFGLAGSCIVASICTSFGESSRQSPAVSFGSESGPIATRRSFETGWPTA
jgi:hypothetical protein